MRKQLLRFFAVFFIIASAVPITLWADETAINAIDIIVELNDDGSATITETWDINNVYKGTEYYISMKNMKDMAVHSLEVWDENGARFETLDNWNADRTFDAKAYTCGIAKISGGYEVCWGISSYGDHIYTVRYVLSGLVKEYSDYAGFNHEFITYGLSSPPQRTSVTITKDGTAFTGSNAGIWAFGFQGNIHFVDGSIQSESESPFAKNSYMTVMCRFDKDLFNPSVVKNTSFESVREKAMKGSDYKSKGFLSGIWGTMMFPLLALILPFSFTILLLVIIRRAQGKVKTSDGNTIKIPSLNKAEYNRNIPFGGSLFATYGGLAAIRRLPPTNQIMGCYLLKWHKDGIVEITAHTSKSKVLKRQKTENAILFSPRTIHAMAEVEAHLYNLFHRAADANGILTESQLEKWSYRNYESLQNWQKEYKDFCDVLLVENGYMAVTQKSGAFSSAKKVALTPKGATEAINAMGFYRYLKDFTIINERRPVEVELWEDYLIFATLFGIAEQVADAFKIINPSYFEANYNAGYHASYHMIIAANHLSHSCHKGMQSASSASSSDGGGGSSSSGGGGGSSGGGGGGGSR